MLAGYTASLNLLKSLTKRMTNTKKSLLFHLRRLHRWLGLIFGIQLFLWALSGLYMVSMDIDFIHGEHLIIEQSPVIDSQQLQFSIPQLLVKYPESSDIRLKVLNSQPVYLFSQFRNLISQ